MHVFPVAERPRQRSQGGFKPRSTDVASLNNGTGTLESSGRELEGVICEGRCGAQPRPGAALKHLTGKLLQAQEEERRRLARELHDGLNQQLAMLAVELGVLARQVPDNQPRLRDQILSLRSRTEGLSNDVRWMTHYLHPATLEHLGLVSALRSYCVEFQPVPACTGSLCRTARRGSNAQGSGPVTLPDCAGTSSNIAKHAGTLEAWVRVSQGRGITLVFSFLDEGCGFIPSRTQGRLRPGFDQHQGTCPAGPRGRKREIGAWAGHANRD